MKNVPASILACLQLKKNTHCDSLQEIKINDANDPERLLTKEDYQKCRGVIGKLNQVHEHQQDQTCSMTRLISEQEHHNEQDINQYLTILIIRYPKLFQLPNILQKTACTQNVSMDITFHLRYFAALQTACSWRNQAKPKRGVFFGTPCRFLDTQKKPHVGVFTAQKHI